MAATPAQQPTRIHPLDAMAVAPGHHETILENDRVRVLDTRLAPGERTPVHAHQWPSALYVLSWSDFVRRDAEGRVIVDSRDWAKRPERGRGPVGRPAGAAFGGECRDGGAADRGGGGEGVRGRSPPGR